MSTFSVQQPSSAPAWPVYCFLQSHRFWLRTDMQLEEWYVSSNVCTLHCALVVCTVHIRFNVYMREGAYFPTGSQIEWMGRSEPMRGNFSFTLILNEWEFLILPYEWCGRISPSPLQMCEGEFLLHPYIAIIMWNFPHIAWQHGTELSNTKQSRMGMQNNISSWRI